MVNKKRCEVKKKRIFLSLIFLVSLFFIGGALAIIISGGNFSVIQFFSGIAGGKADGGVFDARFHSTAFQAVGKGEGGVFTATIGPLSPSNFTQLSMGIYDFNLTDPDDQIISNTSTAIYTIILTNNGTLDDSYTLSVTNENNADVVQLNTTSINNLVSGIFAQFILSVSDSMAGNYTTNVTATSQSNSLLSKTISIATIITTLPSISSYNIFPYSVINGSNALIGISAENADNLYAIITLPNGTAENLALTNDANATFTNTSLIGRYNITLFANNSQGIDNVSDYFESFVPIQFAFRVINFNTTGLNSSWEFYYRGAIIKSNGSSEGTHLSEFPDTLVEIKFKSYSDRLHTTLRGINASLENNKSLGMDKLLTPAPEYLLTYGINNSYNFTNATIRIYYDDIPFTNEGNLKFDKCDDWDFVNQACSGSFNDVTSSAVQNTLENYFEYETTSFSGFGIREVISSGDTGGSTGGGGGGSSCTYNQSYDWQCGVWGSCINGKQIRTCKTTNNCGNTFGRPETNQSCVFLSPKIPEELFDITLELESSAITNSNELATRIIFASFGTIPTHVDLTYVILDSTGNEVYREKGETIVETEAVLSKRFENLQLGDGRYSLILTTLYGDNVTDQFRQEFSVEEEKKISWWIWIAWALIVLILVWILIYYLARKLRKPKIKIVKYSEWKKQQTNRLLDGTKNIQGLENNFFRRMLKILKGGKI